MSAVPATPTKPPEPDIRPSEPKVRGESLYDRVTSMLMAVVVGASLVVGWLFLIYWTNQAYASRVTAPLEIIEVEGGGGGSPEGEVGSIEKVDVPGAEVGVAASNNEEEAAAFEEPSVMLTPSVTLDALTASGEDAVEADFGPSMPSGGPVASGKRSSKLGTGGPAFGFGPGDGGVPRHQRWVIVYPEGQTAEEYARQLDAIGVELATPVNNAIMYASRLSSPNPERRTGLPGEEHRLYFAWKGRGRKANDVALLRKAGIEAGDTILQFYPPQTEETLARLEAGFRGLRPAEIRVTRFKVVPRGDRYGFEVMEQQTLR